VNAVAGITLAGRLRSGDRQAFAEAYQQYKADVLALAAAMLGWGRRDAAGDVLHDVFVGLASAAPLLDPTCNVKAYLLTAAANRSRDRIRKRRPETNADPGIFDAAVSPSQDPPQAALHHEQTECLRAALLELPDEQRVVIALRIYGDLTFAEIGRQEGASEDTVRSRYCYGLEKLRQQLSEEVTNERA
jgi:RNA polymerase sigma factor (sigma-70 family)